MVFAVGIPSAVRTQCLKHSSDWKQLFWHAAFTILARIGLVAMFRQPCYQAGCCFVGFMVLSECQNQNGALDDPEHGCGADGVGRDEFGPARKWNADASHEGDRRQHHTDEQEVAGLDA